ncbi:Inner membrane protein YedI [Corynebacterium capitovis DSM 44611]|uniref:DUF808 domain-containing protein n=1 Tax=Corynebacterium capitovis TaxID=131081 RepID=UPI000371CEB5|nr:DUF808 domain-containing protein [Corynebacterium capitovis]WKD57908.1 Inner membrane protein YedI [Corynebacterium capitovis DSM 44611]
MSGGLLALLDDVALIARTASASVDDIAGMAAKTSAKAAGVVIDDAAVTPQYVSDVSPARELPMIWKITKGSLRNKLVIVLPIALLLNAVAPWALVPILMVGGTYLCFEGAEKIAQKLGGHHEDPSAKGAKNEKTLVRSAITTDLILSAEIMIISLDQVKDEPFLMETAVLIAVGILMTVVVYGAVAVLVKVDDIGLGMIQRGHTPRLGRALVTAMPYVLSLIGVVGTVAMLWVGGHLIIRGLHEVFGWHALHDLIERGVHAVGGGAIGWCVETGISLVIGLIAGFIVFGVMSLVAKVRSR